MNNLLDPKLLNAGRPCKAKTARIFAQTFAEQALDTQMQISDILLEAERAGVFTPKELAELFEKNLGTAYRYINGELPLPKDTLLPLCRWLSERGCNALAELALAPGYTIVGLPKATPNGDIRDEVIRAEKYEVQSVEWFEKGDMKKCIASATKAVTEVLEIVEEAQAK